MRRRRNQLDEPPEDGANFLLRALADLSVCELACTPTGADKILGAARFSVSGGHEDIAAMLADRGQTSTAKAHDALKAIFSQKI